MLEEMLASILHGCARVTQDSIRVRGRGVCGDPDEVEAMDEHGPLVPVSTHRASFITSASPTESSIQNDRCLAFSCADGVKVE